MPSRLNQDGDDVRLSIASTCSERSWGFQRQAHLRLRLPASEYRPPPAPTMDPPSPPPGQMMKLSRFVGRTERHHAYVQLPRPTRRAGAGLAVCPSQLLLPRVSGTLAPPSCSEGTVDQTKRWGKVPSCSRGLRLLCVSYLPQRLKLLAAQEDACMSFCSRDTVPSDGSGRPTAPSRSLQEG